VNVWSLLVKLLFMERKLNSCVVIDMRALTDIKTKQICFIISRLKYFEHRSRTREPNTHSIRLIVHV